MGGDSYVRFIYNRTRPKIERFEAARAERDLLRKAHDSRPLPAVWRFLPDPEDIGVEQKWYQQAPGAHWQEIRVGEFWDTQGFDNYVGYAWYSTEFTVPAAAAGRRVALYFAGIDEQAWVYVDGMLVGEHTGDPDKLWEQPLVVDITARVKYGRAQRLVVRVHNYSMAGGLYKPVSMLTEKGAQ